MHLFKITSFALTSAMAAMLFFSTTAAASESVNECDNSVNTVPCGTHEAQTYNTQPYAHTDRAGQVDPRERERREWRHAEKELDKAQAKPHPKKEANASSQRCEALAQRIEKNDELARQGGTAAYIEKLREDRKNTRDEQFRLGC